MSQAGIALVCFAVLFLFGACPRSAVRSSEGGPSGAKSPAASASTASAAAGPKAPAGPFRITVSTGGGFAGQWQGCTFTSEGEATAWIGWAAGPRETRWSGKADPDSLAAFARALEAHRSVKLDGAGNMTSRLEYAAPAGESAWSIPFPAAVPGAPAADTPEPFRTVYPRIESYCRALAPAP